MTKAIVLLSGGQDSTTSLWWAMRTYNSNDLLALSIFYGQRHEAELPAAAEIAKLAGVRHQVLRADVLASIGDSDLVKKDTEIKASGGYGDHAAPAGLPSSFVPGRNLLFLSLAAAVAVREGCKEIVTGVCQTDYSGYPDCRREFIDSLERTLNLAMPSTSGPFAIQTPLMNMTKAETVMLADEMTRVGVGPNRTCWEALAKSVTCYHGKRPGCGACPACELRAKGFAEAGLADPAQAA
jgi:7-cyano-7-deazaguanine synthase